MRQQHGRRRALQDLAVRGGEDDVVGAVPVGVPQRGHVHRVGEGLGAEQQPGGALADFAVVAAVQQDDVDPGLALPPAGGPPARRPGPSRWAWRRPRPRGSTRSFTTSSSAAAGIPSAGRTCWLRYSPIAVPIARRQASSAGMSSSISAGGSGQPVQVGLELAGLPADGEQRLEDAVAPGGALVRGHQLRLGSVGNAAVLERGVQENQHRGGGGNRGRRGHGFSLVRRTRRDRICGIARSGTVPRVWSLRGSPVLWPFPLAGTLPSWVILILTVVDFVIRVLALGIIPGNRRPTTAMAWLLGIFFVPSVGLVLFLLFGNFRLSRAPAGPAGGGEHARPGRHVRAGRPRKRVRRPRMGGLRGGTEQDAGLAAHGGRQQRGAAARLPGLHQGDGGSRPRRQILRQRRVLHHEHGPRHRRSAHRPGGGRRARRRGPRPVRPPRHAADQGLPQADRPAQGQQDQLAAHAAAEPGARAVAPAGPAQPPQDHGDRRRGRLHRLAEPDRALLQQPAAPQGGPRMGGAHGLPARADRHHAQRRLRHRLAQRDRRIARGPAGAPARIRIPATSRPRWCPAAPASSPRTTCGSSTR